LFMSRSTGPGDERGGGLLVYEGGDEGAKVCSRRRKAEKKGKGLRSKGDNNLEKKRESKVSRSMLIMGRSIQIQGKVGGVRSEYEWEVFQTRRTENTGRERQGAVR